jgi:hypothetical protein
VGKGGGKQPYLTVAAVLVHEDKVQPLSEAMRRVAFEHLGWLPSNFEFHGHEIWGGSGWWSEKSPPELLAAYEAVIGLLEELGLSIAHSSIDKELLHIRYGGAADANAYLLALQFLLEKIDLLGGHNRIVVADEAKEQQLRAIKMVADMQQWGAGEVPGRTLTTVIDSLHYVQSNASSGVQMADLVAYVIQRWRRGSEGHPNAAAALARLYGAVEQHTMTWRDP